jgi:hypothetical protein
MHLYYRATINEPQGFNERPLAASKLRLSLTRIRFGGYTEFEFNMRSNSTLRWINRRDRRQNLTTVADAKTGVKTD